MWSCSPCAPSDGLRNGTRHDPQTRHDRNRRRGWAPRQILAVEMANRESRSSWRDFLLALRQRGLHGVELVVGITVTGITVTVEYLCYSFGFHTHASPISGVAQSA